MGREEIKKILKEHLSITHNIVKHIKSKHKEVYDEIIILTKHLSDKCTFSERVYNVLNDICERPLCKMCDNYVKYNRGKYRIYCSVKCSKNDPVIKQKAKQTNLERHGFEYAMQNKSIQEKSKQTCLKNHGVEYPVQNKEIRNKSKRTNKLKYNVENVMQNKDIQEKSKQTCLKNHGVEYPFQSKEIRDKSKQTLIEKFGVENAIQNTYIREKRKQTMITNHGCEYIKQSQKFIQHQRNKYSKIINEYLQSIHLEMIDDYILSQGHNTFKCLKCGKKFESCWFNIQQGKRCPQCSTLYNVSKPEIEIYEFIKSILNTEIIQNNRDLILNPKTNKYLELDIYIPDIGIAIEFDGLYWHSDKRIDKNYHLMKTNLCKEKGIRLIHIFEDEWMFKKDIVKNKLKQILNIDDNKRIDIKQCIIKEIDSIDVKNDFLEKYHIEGSDDSFINLGGFYNDKLTSIMTFKRVMGDNIYELNRFVSAPKYCVFGIYEELILYFKKKYEWKEIYSYADLRWSVGNIYEKMGFNLSSYSKPNYWCFKNFYRTHNLKSEEGYSRIYDCGNLKYKMINNKQE